MDQIIVKGRWKRFICRWRGGHDEPALAWGGYPIWKTNLPFKIRYIEHLELRCRRCGQIRGVW